MKNNNHQQPKNRMVQQHYDQDFAALEKLKAQGLDYPGLSLRLLRKFDGDVDKVADRLQRRRDIMKRPKNSRSSQRWSAEIKQLQDAGLDYPVAANRLLNKFNGDVDKVAVILNKRKPQLEQRKAKMAQQKQRKQQSMPATVSPNPSSNQQWSAEIKQLQDAGLDYPVAANRLLNKFNGDVDKVAVILNKRKPQLEQRKAKMAQKKQQKQQKQQSMPATVSPNPSSNQQWSAEIKQLLVRWWIGRNCRRHALLLPLLLLRHLGLPLLQLGLALVEDDCDLVDITIELVEETVGGHRIVQARVLQLFDFGAPLLVRWRIGRNCRRHALLLLLLLLLLLRHLGLPLLQLRLALVEDDCDLVDITIELVEETVGGHRIVQARVLQLFDFGAPLQDAGLDYPVAANRLLDKFNGDVDKVAVILNKRKPQLEQRKAKMAQQKQRKQQSMPATVSPNPSSNQQWSAEIKQLQDAGLDYPVAANRLLDKFNGDVDKVAVILNKRKPQLEQRKAKMAQKKQQKQQKQQKQ